MYCNQTPVSSTYRNRFASSMNGRFCPSVSNFHSAPKRFDISELCIFGLSWAILRRCPRDQTMKAFMGRLMWSWLWCDPLAFWRELGFALELELELEWWWWCILDATGKGAADGTARSVGAGGGVELPVPVATPTPIPIPIPIPKPMPKLMPGNCGDRLLLWL